MTTNSTTIAGHAVYLEFRKGPMTTQVIVMPEGRGTSGHTIPMTMYRRRLSPAQPRKTWKIFASAVSGPIAPSMTTSLTTGSIPVPVDFKLEAARRLSFTDSLFTGLAANNWKLFKTPIVVEVEAKDLDEARAGKTPYKIIGRILKVRKSLGFPKELFGEI